MPNLFRYVQGDSRKELGIVMRYQPAAKDAAHFLEHLLAAHILPAIPGTGSIAISSTSAGYLSILARTEEAFALEMLIEALGSYSLLAKDIISQELNVMQSEAVERSRFNFYEDVYRSLEYNLPSDHLPEVGNASDIPLDSLSEIEWALLVPEQARTEAEPLSTFSWQQSIELPRAISPIIPEVDAEQGFRYVRTGFVLPCRSLQEAKRIAGSCRSVTQEMQGMIRKLGIYRLRETLFNTWGDRMVWVCGTAMPAGVAEEFKGLVRQTVEGHLFKHSATPAETSLSAWNQLIALCDWSEGVGKPGPETATGKPTWF